MRQALSVVVDESVASGGEDVVALVGSGGGGKFRFGGLGFGWVGWHACICWRSRVSWLFRWLVEPAVRCDLLVGFASASRTHCLPTILGRRVMSDGREVCPMSHVDW